MLFGMPIWVMFCAVSLPIAAAYFYRRRSRIIEVPALTIWLQVGRPVELRSISSLMRSIISFILQLLIVGVLAVSLAATFRTTTSPSTLVLIVDCGATMQTRESPVTRMELANEMAARLLKSANQDVKVFLIGAASHPSLITHQPMSAGNALGQLSDLRALDVETDLVAALRAASFVQDDPAAELCVISDFVGSDPQVLRALWQNHPAHLRLISVGSDQPNAAIGSLWVQPQRRTWLIGGTISSSQMEGQMVRVSLLREDAMIASTDVVLSGTPSLFKFDVDLESGSLVQIRLENNDALAVDNHAFTVLPSRRKGVCLVTAENWPLVNAISADDSVPLRVVRPEKFDGPRKDEDVVIIDGVELKEPLSGSVGWLVIAAANGPNHLDRPQITSWAGNHPIFADVDPDLFQIRRTYDIDKSLRPTLKPLLSSNVGPLIVETVNKTAEGKRVIYWQFSLQDTDLTTRLSFPVFLWNTIDYLTGVEGFNPAQVATGQPLLLDGSQMPNVYNPTGHSIGLRRLGDKFATTADLVDQGFYRIVTPQEQRIVAASLLSVVGIQPLHHFDDKDNFSKMPQSATALTFSNLWLNWRFLLIAALLMCLIEWLLYHRRLVRVA